MGGIVFIGDELTAAGFRLTGMTTMVPPKGHAQYALAEARRHADVVILTAECAQQISPGELDRAILSETPLVAVIPDIRESAPLPDLARRLRASLGIET
jgi:vacuolar-type H+-ATPase subunit F/Vma7